MLRSSSTLGYRLHTAVLYLLLRRRRMPKHRTRDPKRPDQRPTDHRKAPPKTATVNSIFQIRFTNRASSPPRLMPRTLNLAVCFMMSSVIEMPDIVVEACREATWSCTCCAGLRLALCFVGVACLACVFASLLRVSSPSSASVKTWWWTSELCSSSA